MNCKKTAAIATPAPKLGRKAKWTIALAVALSLALTLFLVAATDFAPAVGEQIDELNGVAIYFNGGMNTVQGRNRTADGYNLGLRYQCVEFVKRYYFERHAHRMPDAYGHARDFFDPMLGDGAFNARRGLRQFVNGSETRPEPEDLVVFSPWLFNRYGHVAIVATVGPSALEIAQQNPGLFGRSRESFAVAQRDGKWFIEHPRVLGWLRLDPPGEDLTGPSPTLSGR